METSRPCEICHPGNPQFCTEAEMQDEPGCPYKVKSLNTAEPPPIKNIHPAVWDLVIADMQERDRFGLQKYNTRLQPFNGRDPLVDAYQEVLDLAVYLRQSIFERIGK